MQRLVLLLHVYWLLSGQSVGELQLQLAIGMHWPVKQVPSEVSSGTCMAGQAGVAILQSSLAWLHETPEVVPPKLLEVPP